MNKPLLLAACTAAAMLVTHQAAAAPIPFNVACSTLSIGNGSGTGPVSCAFDAGAGFTIDILTLYSTPSYSGGSASGTQVDFSYILPAPFTTPQNFSVTGTVNPTGVTEQTLGTFAPGIQAISIPFSVTARVSFGPAIQASFVSSRIAGTYSAPDPLPVPEPGMTLTLLSGVLMSLGRVRQRFRA